MRNPLFWLIFPTLNRLVLLLVVGLLTQCKLDITYLMNDASVGISQPYFVSADQSPITDEIIRLVEYQLDSFFKGQSNIPSYDFLPNKLRSLQSMSNKVDMDEQDKNGYARTALHWAVLIKNTIIVEHLLDHGASIDATDDRQQTPLHIAAIHANRDIISLLIQRGANIDTEDIWGVRPKAVES